MKTKNVKQTIVKTLLISLLFALPIAFISCEEDEENNKTDNKDNQPEKNIIDSAYVVNEGAFQSTNATITLLNVDSNVSVTKNKLFNKANGWKLGDIAQSMSFHNDKAYIVVNNSQKMEIVDKRSFKSVAVMEGLSYPRQFMGISKNKGYLTDGSSSNGKNAHILVIDLNSYSIADSIEVGKGPESMLKKDKKVYVTNFGGYSTGKTVSVIDSEADTLLENITVAEKPADIASGANGNIWVYCKGTYNTSSYTYNAKLVKIDSESYETTTYDIGEISSFGSYLMAISPDKETIYYTGSDGIYAMDVNASDLPASASIEEMPYGINVHPGNGNIFCLVSAGTNSGYAIRYDTEYNLLDSTKVGISPNSVVFE
jgi:hypothetical protein